MILISKWLRKFELLVALVFSIGLFNKQLFNKILPMVRHPLGWFPRPIFCVKSILNVRNHVSRSSFLCRGKGNMASSKGYTNIFKAGVLCFDAVRVGRGATTTSDDVLKAAYPTPII